MLFSLLQNRISSMLALAVLVAIAAVLISPAVPSAPTLLPVSALLLLGLIVVCSHAVLHIEWPVLTLLGSAQPTGPGLDPEFLTAGLPLRR